MNSFWDWFWLMVWWFVFFMYLIILFQICADLFECDGWTVRFAGGGVPDDEVLKHIGENRPDQHEMFGTLPRGVPAVRKLIDYLREVGICQNMQVKCCG